jgi:hypothetical protein
MEAALVACHYVIECNVHLGCLQQRLPQHKLKNRPSVDKSLSSLLLFLTKTTSTETLAACSAENAARPGYSGGYVEPLNRNPLRLVLAGGKKNNLYGRRCCFGVGLYLAPHAYESLTSNRPSDLLVLLNLLPFIFSLGFCMAVGLEYAIFISFLADIVLSHAL